MAIPGTRASASTNMYERWTFGVRGLLMLSDRANIVPITYGPLGPITDELASAGGALFRRRSYMPLVLVPLFVLSVFDGRSPTPLAWEAACLPVAICGRALRAFVVGTAPQGASTRGTRRPTA